MPGELAPMDIAGRLPRLRERLEEAGVEALLVTAPANVRYLSGFSGSAGMLLVSRRAGDLLLTDGRYRTQSAEELARAGVEAEIEIGRPPAQREALAKAVAKAVAGSGQAGAGQGRLGLEAASVTWAAQQTLAEALSGVELVPTTGLVESLRMVKDAGELARMEAAAAVADAALAEVLPLLAEGPTEAEVALALDHHMRRLGASASSFPTIVASGSNGAKPHARPSGRRIGEGELVVVDFGAVVEGYCSDMTRTLCLGSPSSSVLAAVVEVVAASQAAGLAAVGPGVAAADVDRACREVVAGAGWSESFPHSTGHGVGLDVHEAPAVGPTSADSLVLSSVVTVEPGVYLPGHGGARIEDTVVVTPDGCRALTRAPQELVVA